MASSDGARLLVNLVCLVAHTAGGCGPCRAMSGKGIKEIKGVKNIRTRRMIFFLTGCRETRLVESTHRKWRARCAPRWRPLRWRRESRRSCPSRACRDRCPDAARCSSSRSSRRPAKTGRASSASATSGAIVISPVAVARRSNQAVHQARRGVRVAAGLLRLPRDVDLEQNRDRCRHDARPLSPARRSARGGRPIR